MCKMYWCETHSVHMKFGHETTFLKKKYLQLSVYTTNYVYRELYST